MQERQTIQDMRAAGFSEEQALLLASKFEATAQATSQDLKSFISTENERLRAEVRMENERLRAELRADMKQLRADLDVRFAQIDSRFAAQEACFERALRVQSAAILTAIVGVATVAVAIIKLFPNAH